ncbi:hypothetical protein EU537_12080 [Candidatus Thorarchaeota archaeon]|nr:MAG: hypothetical protein EU537_12080 [Candidatus Thorarchaeota archaeon]
MPIEVRTATARDRKKLQQFYSREGLSFDRLASRTATLPMGSSSETMFIIAVTDGIVCAAMKLDIGESPEIGKIGFIQHLEIEDELESTDLGEKMLLEAENIARDRNLRALDTVVSEDRPDSIKLYENANFQAEHREIYMRKHFRNRVF